MSFPTREAAENHRAAGKMPLGGPYLDFDKLSTTPRDEMSADARGELAQQLLEIASDHPADTKVHGRLLQLTLQKTSIAMHLTPAMHSQVIEAARAEREGLCPEFDTIPDTARDSLFPDERAALAERLVELHAQFPKDNRIAERIDDLTASTLRREVYSDSAMIELVKAAARYETQA